MYIVYKQIISGCKLSRPEHDVKTGLTIIVGVKVHFYNGSGQLISPVDSQGN